MQASLKCFGVGDGWPCADGAHSSYLYRIAGKAFLIDCGEPISGNYKASGLGYDLVDRIFLSHLHFDHVGGFFMLIQGFWLEKRRKPLAVHLPGPAIQPIRAMLEAGCIFNELLLFDLSFHPLEPGRPIEWEGVRVTPFATTHLDQLKEQFQDKHPGRFEAYSFLIEADGRCLGHSADLGSPTDLEPLLTRPLDLLVCELAHFHPEELFAYLAGRPIKHLGLIHLGRPHRARLDELRALAAKRLPPITWSIPGDMDEIQIRSASASSQGAVGAGSDLSNMLQRRTLRNSISI